jgi:hypothetical protein
MASVELEPSSKVYLFLSFCFYILRNKHIPLSRQCICTTGISHDDDRGYDWVFRGSSKNGKGADFAMGDEYGFNVYQHPDR